MAVVMGAAAKEVEARAAAAKVRVVAARAVVETGAGVREVAMEAAKEVARVVGARAEETGRSHPDSQAAGVAVRQAVPEGTSHCSRRRDHKRSRGPPRCPYYLWRRPPRRSLQDRS